MRLTLLNYESAVSTKADSLWPTNFYSKSSKARACDVAMYFLSEMAVLWQSALYLMDATNRHKKHYQDVSPYCLNVNVQFLQLWSTSISQGGVEICVSINNFAIQLSSKLCGTSKMRQNIFVSVPECPSQFYTQGKHAILPFQGKKYAHLWKSVAYSSCLQEILDLFLPSQELDVVAG